VALPSPVFATDTFQYGTFQENYVPEVAVLNTPSAGATYRIVIALDATLVDAEGPPFQDDSFQTNTFFSVFSLDSQVAEFQYDRNDGTWVSIGDGASVVTGGRSLLSWDISVLLPGTYRVRVRARDVAGQLSPYITTGTFIIGPGFAGLFAESNTSKYRPDVNTTSYRADPNTSKYVAVKT
jgi:hypothetical protein